MAKAPGGAEAGGRLSPSDPVPPCHMPRPPQGQHSAHQGPQTETEITSSRARASDPHSLGRRRRGRDKDKDRQRETEAGKRQRASRERGGPLWGNFGG